MKAPVSAFVAAFAAFAAFVALVGGIIHIVWWKLAHNFTNVSCSNWIYQSHHLQSCAVWSRACGIVLGVDLPLIIGGFFGMVGAGFWFAIRWEDHKTARQFDEITKRYSFRR